MFHDLSLPLRTTIPASVQETFNKGFLISQGHVGTHLDRLLGSEIPLHYFKSRAVVFDVSGFCPDREVGTKDIAFELIQPGDFVMLHTGYVSRYGYGSQDYLKSSFDVSWDLVQHLLDRKLHYIGVDARGLRRNEEHLKVDEHCERAGVFVIENINDMEKLPVRKAFTVYTMCFDAGGTGLPCRIVAETAEEPDAVGM
ncbi:MAG: cyclase family protein [Desulfovibrio sp.]|nr:cyclase family protein [Desulfovibrio sp.]